MLLNMHGILLLSGQDNGFVTWNSIISPVGLSKSIPFCNTTFFPSNLEKSIIMSIRSAGETSKLCTLIGRLRRPPSVPIKKNELRSLNWNLYVLVFTKGDDDQYYD